jgi:hypothetical protein
VLYTVTVTKTEVGYKIEPLDRVAATLHETERLVRANYQVIPEEWSTLKAELERSGKASIERSLGKFEQVS